MTIRVLVVDDSLTVRKHLVEVLERAGDFEVVAEAGDGKTAIGLCESLRPDAVTLDMMLPVMSGLAATEYIMAFCPTPILIVSASYNRGELYKTYEALAAGAIDVLDKPTGDEDAEDWEQRLVSAVRAVSRVKTITHPRARLGAYGQPRSASVGPIPEHAGVVNLVAIGGSTGAPGAVLEILRGLGAGYRLPILLVIHIGEPFGEAFAEWLDGLSPLGVSFAVDRQPLPRPERGCVIMAPPGSHLVVEHGLLRLSDAPPRHSCKPAVDVLFHSLATEMAAQTCACLLTGMGKDGAEGLLAIRRGGGVTYAQDEASSIVYGMPREAMLLGAAPALALDQFPRTLLSVAAKGRVRAP